MAQPTANRPDGGVYDDDRATPSNYDSALEAEHRRLLAEAEHSQQATPDKSTKSEAPEDLKEKEGLLGGLTSRLAGDSTGDKTVAAAAAGLFKAGAEPSGLLEIIKGKFTGK